MFLLFLLTKLIQYYFNNTPLHYACFAGNFLIVEHLLLMGVDLRAQTINHVFIFFLTENSS